ncbi:serine hydrolase [Streptomyces sp. NBC_00140]|uniref:serine hydrolase n=1 Tax=Streptomyces sp. NBC_00140 TaxID=2975664 RepID=UPI002257B82E|nr:serine hydrolase [Streptomyces sp. NBC_00140]MCX5333390.1 D-alanyl-D-alanine carboxypeptidase [Streptomyces sp. NBC_00140]
MAGESPDRSKQRESSAEPTSGSASPVPEARGEVRDPRLAVARDTEPPAARGGVDTATRVFSARDVAQARSAAQEAKPTGPEEAPGTPDEAATATEGPQDTGKADEQPPAAEDVQDAVPADGAEGTGGAVAADGGPVKGAAVAEDVQDAQDAEPADDAEGAGGSAEAGAGVSEAAEGAGDAAAAEDVQDAVPTDGAEGSRDAEASAATVEPASGGAESAADARAGVSKGAEAAAVADDGPVKGAEGAEGAAAAEDVQDAVPADSAKGSRDAESAERAEDAAATDDGPVKGAEGAEDAVPTDGAEGSRGVKASAATVEPAAAGDVQDAVPTGGAEDAAAAEDVHDAVPDDSAEGSRDVEDSAGPGETASAVPEGEVGGGDARLRAAVAAWVRSGDSPDAADSGGEAGEKADAAATDPRATADPSDAVDARQESAQATREPGEKADAGATDPRATADPSDAVDARQESAQATREPGEKADAAATDPRATADPSDAVDARQESAQATREAGEKADKPVPGADGNDAPRVDQPTTMLKLPSKFVALKPDVTTAIPQVGPERTTQQPLPPKPPLDLLAELTNTPPPPQTPLRTTFRRVKIWTPLVLLLAVVFAVAQSMRPLPTPTLELTAEDSYSFDGSKVDIPWPADGQAALDVQGIGSFGSSGDQKPVPIASVAKVMTAYVILRDHPLKSGDAGPKIKIDQTAEDQSQAGQESTVNVTAGDSISQREALESILIASANNVARLLARWDAGSEKAFVEKMNAAAEDLGMTNTTYTDPSGLNDTTVSTAVDQVKLGKKAMEEPAFREVAAMMSYDDYKGVNHSNWNQIVGKNNVVGIKTGTTTSALGNLLFAAKKEVNGETRTIVGAVVRQPAGGVDNTILSAALTAGDQLIRAAQGALESATILKKGDVVGYVDDGLGGRTPVVATKDVTAVGWSGLTVKLTFAADDVPHTAKAGTKVGTLTVGDASAGAVKVPVALQKDLVEPGFTDKLTRIS